MKSIYSIIDHVFQAYIDDQTAVISSTGYISRIVYAFHDRPLNFYMQGSMGNALAIGLGIAINSDIKVVVINGDGSVLMSLGTVVLMENLCPYNLKHVIIDNNAHASTGGQKTCSTSININTIAKNTFVFKTKPYGCPHPHIPMSCQTIQERFKHAMSNLMQQKH